MSKLRHEAPAPYVYKSGRTVEEVYDELYSGPKYGAGEHGGGAEWMCEGYESLLDVGGGKTPTAARYGQHAKMKRVAVCDISEKALNKLPKGIERLQCDITQGLPYADNEFDIICCFDVLEHLHFEAVDFVISELGRVARCRLILTIAYRQAVNKGSKDELLHLTVRPQAWWFERLRTILKAEIVIHKCVRRIKHGRPRYGDTLLIDLPTVGAPVNVFRSKLKLPNTVYILGSGILGKPHHEQIPEDAFVIALNKAILIRPCDIWMVWAMNYFKVEWWQHGWNNAKVRLFGDRLMGTLRRKGRALPEYFFLYIPTFPSATISPRYYWQKPHAFKTPANEFVKGLLRAGASIAGAALQLCYFFGVKKVILCGVDMRGHHYFDGTIGTAIAKYQNNNPKKPGIKWSEAEKLQDMITLCEKHGMTIRTISPTALKVKRLET